MFDGQDFQALMDSVTGGSVTEYKMALWNAYCAIASAKAHDSDCATHNMPAMPNGPCDCLAKAN